MELPDPVRDVVTSFHTCEFATTAKDGTPIVWPTSPMYQPEDGRFLVTTSIGLPQKALNARRDPKVSLLFSNPTGSGLTNPASVLVQGDAVVTDDVVTWNDDLARFWPYLYRLQPFGKVYSRTAPSRWFMDWYFMRLLIHVTPRTIRWWPDGDFSRAPQVLEDRDVA